GAQSDEPVMGSSSRLSVCAAFIWEVCLLMNGRDIAAFAARTADDKKGTDILIYDLRGLTDVNDYFVIVTAHSKAQIRAIIETIARDLKEIGIRKMGQEGNESGRWV